jgi:transcriptional regulator with XRE-family HTH domain
MVLKHDRLPERHNRLLQQPIAEVKHLKGEILMPPPVARSNPKVKAKSDAAHIRWLKFVRHNQEWTAKQMADACRTSFSDYSRLERGAFRKTDSPFLAHFQHLFGQHWTVRILASWVPEAIKAKKFPPHIFVSRPQGPVPEDFAIMPWQEAHIRELRSRLNS